MATRATEPLSASARLDPATTVGAVHLRVRDLEVARKFYTRVLGLTAAEVPGGELSLSANGKTPLLFFAEDRAAPPRDPRTTGLYHFALLVPSRAEFGHVLRHLAKTQYELDGLVDHTISEALYLTDPEGNGIEIARDYPRETWARAMGDMQRRPQTMNKPLDVEGVMRAADGEPREWDGISRGTVMGHVHLHVRDVEEALGFYRDVLGFDVMANLGSAAFISAGGYHHHLGLNVWAGPRPPAPGAVGLKHFTIELPSESERARVLARLAHAGARVEETAEGPVVADPTGNRALLSLRAHR